MLGRFWSPAAATLPLWSDSRPEFGSICIFPLQVCTTCSSTIDTLIAIIGMDRIVSIYSLSTVSNLSVLVVAEPDFQWNSNFNGIQYWRHQRFCRIIFNVDFFLLSLLHYLLQDLIFIANPNRVRCFLDFQGSMVTLRSPSDSNLQHCLLWLPTAPCG